MIIERTDLNRREFLMTLSGLIGALAFLPTQGLAWSDALDANDGLKLPVDLGRHYLGLFGQEPELASLRARIRGSVNSVLSQTALVEELRLEISQDYLSAQDFEYKKWLLSRTEGRLCALAALEES